SNEKSIFDDELTYTVPFTIQAFDSEFNTTFEANVKIIDVNRPPVIVSQTPVAEFTATAGYLANFTVTAFDPDNDALTYIWKPGTFEKYEGGSTHLRRLINPGIKKMKVIVTDGEFEAEIGWVYAVNRQQTVIVQEEIVASSPQTNLEPIRNTQSYVIG
ncbi:hypothetical protein KY312_02495, partial [Candidatus Woesearchaeota archaeon]|nr:hypothetical protein [Candidatus Woesearchaeota archaeon]